MGKNNEMLIPGYRKRSTWKTVLWSILAFISLVSFAGVIGIVFLTETLPDFNQINAKARSQTSRLYSSDGQLLATFSQENRVFVPIYEIPQRTRMCVVCAEDKRFFSHKGVDLISITRAFLNDIKSKTFEQGGSTITQQYIKNAYFSPKRDLLRKLKEAIMAVQMEWRYPKEKILEKYLNIIYFGEGAYGIEAASETYFKKSCSRLTLSESALLAGLIKNPSRYSPVVHREVSLRRRDRVLDKMANMGWVSLEEARRAKKEKIELNLRKKNRLKYPYFVEYVKEIISERYGEDILYKGGLRIKAGIDTGIQRLTEKAVAKYLHARSGPDAAVVVLEPKTGIIKAIVGGKDFSRQKFNVAVQGHRQPGSAFKPFVLTAAILKGISIDEVFSGVSPRTFALPYGWWRVRNFNNSSYGDLRLEDAMAFSVNTIFAEIVHRIGANKVAAAATDLGITSPLDFRPSIALGGLRVGVSPLEMARAYSTFANGGVKRDPTPIKEIRLTDGTLIESSANCGFRVIDASVAYLVNLTLEKTIKEGTGAAAGLGRPAAGKTGTTQNLTDAWFVGYTPQLLTAVWVGYTGAKIPMSKIGGMEIRGSTIPAYIWNSIMSEALKTTPPRDFPKPPTGSIVTLRTCSKTRLLANGFCPHTSKLRFPSCRKPESVCQLHFGVVAPDVRLMAPSDAINILHQSGLKARIANGDSKSGEIASQSPRPGKQIAAGSTVFLRLKSSRTNEATEVLAPNLIGLQVSDAQNILRDYGLKISFKQKNGVVIDQTPKPDTNVKPPGTVPQSGNSTIVPYLIGLSREGALQVIRQNALKSSIRTITTLGYPPGTVVGQRPTAGTAVRNGYTIVIELSKTQKKLH